MPTAVRVLVADDQAPFRDAARAVLGVDREFEIVGEVGSGEEAIDAARTLRPDVVVMDVVMEGIGGIEATRRIVASRPETIVVLVSSYRPEDVREVVADSGAAAFVSKDRFSASALRRLVTTPTEVPPPRGTSERL
jgi:DNA-binding NarL/FixJ family response regulator